MTRPRDGIAHSSDHRPSLRTPLELVTALAPELAAVVAVADLVRARDHEVARHLRAAHAAGEDRTLALLDALEGRAEVDTGEPWACVAGGVATAGGVS